MQVPADAHVLDVVFNDGENSTFFDNNGGLDYHIPVEGGKGAMPGIKVCLCVFGGGGEGQGQGLASQCDRDWGVRYWTQIGWSFLALVPQSIP